MTPIPSVTRDVTAVMDAIHRAAALAGRHGPPKRFRQHPFTSTTASALKLACEARLAYGCNNGGYSTGICQAA